MQQIKKSIIEFGFNDPLAIDENNVIIEGHGRFFALKELGYTECECIRLSHMNEQQKKGYILVHNKLTMNTGYNSDILQEELADITDIDMGEFDFEVKFDDDEHNEDKEFKDSGYFGDERERTVNNYNLREFDSIESIGYYQMPTLDPCNYIPDDIIGFNQMLSTKNTNVGIHFYIDDYQFERVWQSPDIYIDKMKKYQCVFTPDFSLYQEMPMAMKIWNIYRSRLIGQMCQRKGIKVIPTVSWCEKETFDFCFDGLPEKSTLSISTIGVKQDTKAFDIWKEGMDEMIRRLSPNRLLVYGGEVEYDYGKTKVIYYKNHVVNRMRGVIG